jgi:hypothetical protein
MKRGVMTIPTGSTVNLWSVSCGIHGLIILAPPPTAPTAAKSILLQRLYFSSATAWPWSQKVNAWWELLTIPKETRLLFFGDLVESSGAERRL